MNFDNDLIQMRMNKSFATLSWHAYRGVAIGVVEEGFLTSAYLAPLPSNLEQLIAVKKYSFESR